VITDNKGGIMDIFEFALQMEQEGMDLYIEIAEKSDDEGIKKIFGMLAADEKKHQDVIRLMRDSDPAVEETEVLSNAKNVFTEMKSRGDKIDTSQPQADLYRKAMGIEAGSIKFYTEKGAEEQNPGKKKIFEALAAEEKKHLFLLENLVEFISRPETWLEDAEFNHLDEY
jgi:rubrerythrin